MAGLAPYAGLPAFTNPGTNVFSGEFGGIIGAPKYPWSVSSGSSDPNVWPFSNTNVVPTGLSIADISGGLGGTQSGAVESFFPSLGSGSDIGSPAADLGSFNFFSQPSVDSNSGQIAQPVSGAAVDAASGFGIPGDTTDANSTAAAPALGSTAGLDFGPFGNIGLTGDGLIGIVTKLFGGGTTGTTGTTATSPDQSPVAGTSFFQNIINIGGNFFTRAGLVLLALIVIGIGLWAMLSKSKIGVTIRDGASRAAAGAAA